MSSFASVDWISLFICLLYLYVCYIILCMVGDMSRVCYGSCPEGREQFVGDCPLLLPGTEVKLLDLLASTLTC